MSGESCSLGTSNFRRLVSVVQMSDGGSGRLKEEVFSDWTDAGFNTREEVGVVSIMERQRLMEGRDAALGGGDALAGTMGATNKFEKPSGLSSWGATSFMRSIRMASSSSPLVSEENFLNGLPPSVEASVGASCVVVTVAMVKVAVVVVTAVELEPAVDDNVVEVTTVTGFTGETANCVLAGDRSRLSLRGAQLIGTLKQSSSTFLPLSE